MHFWDGYKLRILILLIGFFACLSLSFLTLQANAQVTELTGNSTENLIAPGINVESNGAVENTNDRSRYGVYERALVKAIDQIGAQTDNGAALKFNYTIQIISGEYKDKTYTVNGQEGLGKIRPHPGDTIMVFLQPGGSDTEPQIYLESYDRKNLYLAAFTVLIFILLFFYADGTSYLSCFYQLLS